MFKLLICSIMLLFSLSCVANAQVINLGGPVDGYGNRGSLDPIQAGHMDTNFLLINSHSPNHAGVQSPSGSVSALDLKAPGKARREYDHGYQLLMQNNLQAAVDHLTKAIAIYPKFVAAHNALGTAYLNQSQNDLALAEFTQSVALDDHLPNSYLNLGCTQLALKQYPAAEESLRKASTIAPLDLQLKVALAYGEFANRDYPAVLTTAYQVHQAKHEGAAVVHFFAAGAWEAQDNLTEARQEMETLLQEDPKSASADQFRKILSAINAEQARKAEAKLHPAQAPTLVAATSPRPAGPTPEEAAQAAARQRQIVRQQEREENQIAEAEAAPDPTCVDCAMPGSGASSSSPTPRAHDNLPEPTFRVTADEVSIFFAATDHGKSVTNLAASDVKIRDDSRPPGTILGFRNESQLPLRLGLVVDTSESVTDRLSFEKGAAARFLQEAAVDENSLAFVVGVNNSVFLVQDFTADQTLISHAVNQLAPGGGTALWDAVAFAADKLASHPETQPVARILVVISDGEDNSSGISLKQAIATAQRGEVAVYTVSTREEGSHEEPSALLGDHALRTLSELTGGAASMPGSLHGLTTSLADLQQVIRSRYLVSYKPAGFQRDGRYRTIDIDAEKDGRKLKVFARKGYYASAAQADSSDNNK
jgi:Ca-activated chloride channel family protein